MLIDTGRDHQTATGPRRSGARSARRAILGTVALAAGAAAWLAWPATAARPAPPDLALVRSAAGVVAVDTTERTVARSFAGVPSPDGGAVVAAEPEGTTTRLTAHDPTTGDPLWEREVDGRLGIELVGFDAEYVVLGPDDDGSTYAPTPRSYTRLVVSRPDGGARTYDLMGNYEPEAFARDGQSLFVISYVPPTAPERYQVRRLDLTTGEVGPVYTPHEELQEEMGGSARTQAWSADGDRLYTLYTDGEGAGRRGFVHVLDLRHGWAHCIDLPPELPLSDEFATGLGLSADGTRLVVVDAAAGVLAEVDTRELTVGVARTLDGAALSADAGPVAVAIADDGAVVVGQGQEVVVLDSARLQPRAVASVPAQVVGFHVAPSDALHVVLVDRRIVVLDRHSAEQLDLYRLPGTSAVEQVGRGARQVEPFRQDIVCAC